MKRLWICGCFALLCGACDDKTADEPVWNGDNYVTAFSLTVGEATYEAVVHDGESLSTFPYDASLDEAEVHYELCEHASIHPDPATIRDWSQEWQFLVSSYGQSDRTYIYTVNRTDVATGGSLTLRTQAEVDAFAASRISRRRQPHDRRRGRRGDRESGRPGRSGLGALRPDGHERLSGRGSGGTGRIAPVRVAVHRQCGGAE